MTINELFASVNNAIEQKDFYPASLITDENELEKYSHLTGRQLTLFEEVKNLCEQFGIDTQHIYFTDSIKGLSPYYYYDFPLLIEIPAMDEQMIEFLQVPRRIQEGITYFNKKMSNQKYREILFAVDGKIRFLALHKLFPLISDEEKYELFCAVYTQEDYGFDTFSPQLIEEAFSHQTEAYRKDVLQELDSVCPDDELIIYRGMGEKSTSPEKAYSWTLSFKVALFFANRFNDNGEIVAAKIKKTDVIDYITGRNEEEIICRYENLYEIQPFNMVKTSEEMKRLDENYSIYEYHRYVNAFDKNLFFNPDGIHGMMHMKRVLLHVLSLATEFQLDDVEQEILVAAALYHDIGRTHDGRDDFHGEKSWDKLNSPNVLNQLNEQFEFYDEELHVLRFIIENHCLTDITVWEKLKSTDFPGYSQEKVKELTEIFKDADGLDRVRLGDLNIDYLRTLEAKKRVIFAQNVLQFLQ